MTLKTCTYRQTSKTPKRTSNPKHRLRWVKSGSLLVVVLALVGACTVPNPSTTGVLANSWGQDIEPTEQEVVYSDAGIGCAPDKLVHDTCGGSTTLDIYKHRKGASRGTIVYIHGGGFTLGDKNKKLSGMDSVIRYQLDRGWDIVSINYRLAVKDANKTMSVGNLFPTAYTDVAAAIAWVKANGADHQIDPTRIVTAGHSAGGTLAVLAGVAKNSSVPSLKTSTKIDGYIGIAGIYNFTLPGTSQLWGREWMGRNFKGHQGAASASTWLDKTDPPGYLIYGDLDGFVDPENSRDFKNRANAGGFGQNVSADQVDFWDTNQAMPASMREHYPNSGANLHELNAYLDKLP